MEYSRTFFTDYSTDWEEFKDTFINDYIYAYNNDFEMDFIGRDQSEFDAKAESHIYDMKLFIRDMRRDKYAHPERYTKLHSWKTLSQLHECMYRYYCYMKGD